MSNGVGGLLHYFYTLDEWSILPSLIFLGVGAMTDFGPLIANPKSFLLGAAAQFGIFACILRCDCDWVSMTKLQLQSPSSAVQTDLTSIFLCRKTGTDPGLLGTNRSGSVFLHGVSSYYPASDHEIIYNQKRACRSRWSNLRPVSKLERILFPIVVTIVVCLILPTTAPLVGMLMLGNLFRESGVVRQLSETASNALMYIVVILLGTSVGASTSAEAFLNWTTIKIVILGLVAFMFGTAAGVSIW